MDEHIKGRNRYLTIYNKQFHLWLRVSLLHSEMENVSTVGNDLMNTICVFVCKYDFYKNVQKENVVPRD